MEDLGQGLGDFAVRDLREDVRAIRPADWEVEAVEPLELQACEAAHLVQERRIDNGDLEAPS